MRSLLDEAMPAYDASEVHEIRVDAPPALVYRELLALTPREVRVFGPLMGLRAIPSRLRGRPYGIQPSRSLLEQFVELGFVRLREDPGSEIVVGAVGRFWRLAGNLPVGVGSAEEFADFAEPGFAKAAMSFRVEPAGFGEPRRHRDAHRRHRRGGDPALPPLLAPDPAGKRPDPPQLAQGAAPPGGGSLGSAG